MRHGDRDVNGIFCRLKMSKHLKTYKIDVLKTISSVESFIAAHVMHVLYGPLLNPLL